MYVNIYLASAKQLPLVPWNGAQPAFHVRAIISCERDNLVNVFEEKYFFYSVGSFMGCLCGLICDESFKHEEPETYGQRVQDILLFKQYLVRHSSCNCLRLFATEWASLPELYPEAALSLSGFNAAASDIPEDILWTITA